MQNYLTSRYLHKEKRKVFFVAGSGLCNLNCPYCITNRPRVLSSLRKEDFSSIFDHFGENIYFIFSGIGDFFCGYQQNEQLLRFLLQHDVRMVLDINGIEIKELGDRDLEGKDKIDFIDISCHFGTMKKQGLLNKWVDSIRKIHDNGYDYHIKMILSPLERDLWNEGIIFYRDHVFPLTRKKLILSPDYLGNINSQLNEIETISAAYEEIAESLPQYASMESGNFSRGNTPPCPAGNRYFRIDHEGNIIPCDYLSHNLNISLGNTKKEIASLESDVLCNFRGFCDCGWTAFPRFGLFDEQNKPYPRRLSYLFESSQQDISSLPQETNTITYHFSKIGYDLPILKNIVLKGRAHINDTVNENNIYHILLASEKKVYMFNSFPRSAYAIHADDAPVNDLNFFVFIPYDAVEPGKYNVGIYIRNNHTEALQYTNETVNID